MEFNNANNCYYGHGTNIQDMNKFFEYGIRCSHQQLYYTTYNFGIGSEKLASEVKPQMGNWPHKNAQKIVVASIPIKYFTFDVWGSATYGKGQAVYYNEINAETAMALDLKPGYYLKPEFILGYYDVKTDKFISNPRYYENLSLEEQEKLNEEVKNRYLDIINEAFGINEYIGIISELDGWVAPVTESEIEEYLNKNQMTNKK